MANTDAPQTAVAINEKCHQILRDLYDNIKQYDSDKVSNLLSDFKVLTREKTLSNDVLDDRCMKLLVECSKNNQTESQKCLSNLILNYAHIRENLVQPYVDCVELRLKAANYSYDSNFSNGITKEGAVQATHVKDKSKSCEILYYDLRIIFLLSALCSGSRANIRDRLLEPILIITQREADALCKENYLLIIESLKTLFNLTLDKCINAELAAQVIRKLFSIVGTDRDINVDHETGAKLDSTDQLLVNLIHLLTNMPERVYHELSDDDVNKVLHHLDEQLKTFTKSSFRDTILPVLNACANICRYKENVRQHWFDEIIGSTQDFEKRPEEYDTLRGRLVKLMTSIDVHIKEIAAEFLHALCGGDTEKFITYMGFGNSAAFLATKGLLSQSAERNHGAKNQIEGGINEELQESEADKKYRELRDKLDPITGKLERPKRNPMEGMSDEEKEWHAHELASAIAKLSKLGVMQPMSIDAEGETSELRPSSLSPPPPLKEEKEK